MVAQYTFSDTPIQPSRLDTKRAMRNTSAGHSTHLPVQTGIADSSATGQGKTSERQPANPSRQHRYRMKAARNNRS
ncbi:MAG: hypothetical protein LBP58_10575 [Azoarcus sp.]|jgi:hypothetical protein|nr:hypothetical protein [Azoarcus sp.]